MSTLEALFQPIRIRNLEIKNRLVMAPMTTRLAAEDGSVTEGLIAYYEARARGGVGLVILEMASPEPAGRHRAGELGAYDDRFVDGLRRLTERLKGHGARVAIQIGHAGAYTSPRVTGRTVVAPSPIPQRVHERVTHTVRPTALTSSDIQRLVAAFADTAERAKGAGFDAVELHGAHGYLIGQFLSPLFNRRDDEYGGSLRNRARFALEVTEACRERLGDSPLFFRFSADEYAPGGFTPEEGKELAGWLVEAGADVLDISAGSYKSLPSPHVVIPPMTFPQGVFVPLAHAIKQLVPVPVIAVGRLHDPALAARVIAEGQADMVALGRALIADPDLPNKARAGQPEDIRPCIACNTCLDSMRDGATINCLVNPRAGQEVAAEPRPAQGSKRVLVVGGGPGGMEAAARLAERGHRVTLWEQKERLGGQLLLAPQAPLFQKVEPSEEVLLRFVGFLSHRLARTGVEVRLGFKASPGDVAALRPDAVVLATGASYRGVFGWAVPLLLKARRLRGPRARQLLKRPWVQSLLVRLTRRSTRSLLRPLRRAGISTYSIGDCVRPARVAEALRSALDVAERV